MKKLILIILFINSHVSAQDYVLLSSKDTLFVPIKSMKMIKYLLIDEMGVYVKSDFEEEKIEFNNQGYKLYGNNGNKKYEFFELDGGEKHRHIKYYSSYKMITDEFFDNSNNMILRERFYDDSLAFREINKYNINNKIVSYKRYGEGKLSHNKAYSYDEKGRLIEFDEAADSGYMAKEKYEYSLSSNGEKITHINKRMKSGEIYKRTEYFKGDKIHKSTSSSYGDIIYLYDSKGRLILKEEIEGYLGDKEEYQYDINGNKINQINYRGKILRKNESWLYDDNNRIILNTATDYKINYEKGLSEFYFYNYNEFKYDKNGNLIYKKTCTNLEQNKYCETFMVQERIIQY